MTEKEIMMARQASRLYRNLQAENQRLREQLKGDPRQDEADREVFQLVREHRGNQPVMEVYQVQRRPVFDFEKADVMDGGSLVFLPEEEEVVSRKKGPFQNLRFCGAVAVGVMIWTARHLNWVDTTTAIALTVVLGLMASYFG